MKGRFNKLSPNRHTANEERRYTLEIDIDTNTALSLSKYFFEERKVEEIEFSVVDNQLNEIAKVCEKLKQGWRECLSPFACKTPIMCDMEVIFNEPATILYRNGKKYVSKCDKEDKFSEELGLALCLLKSFGVSYSDFEKLLKGAKRQGKKDE